MPTVQTNGVETYYERRGEGPPVVFVHAAILDHTQWTPQLDALSEDYTTIAYDVRGHGRTGGSPARTYSIELFADDLHALVSALDLENPVICGLSTGGCIAQVYAARHPDSIAGVVLADTFTPELFDRREWLQRSAILRATIPPVRLVGYERVEKAMVWLQERIEGKGPSGDYEKIEELRRDSPKMSTDEFAKVVRAVADFHQTTIDLHEITAPALVLYGENEIGFVHKHAAKLAAELPDPTVHTIPDAGHAANLDNPTAFTEHLRAFLDDVAARQDHPTEDETAPTEDETA